MNKKNILRAFLCFACLHLTPAEVPLFSSYAAAQSQTVTVQDTLNFAFAYSPNIKAAQEARQQSVHNVRMAEAGYYPTIGIWAGGGVQQTDNVSTRAARESEDVVGAVTMGMNISQTIWQGGQTSASVRMGQAEVNMRAWQLMDSANSLAYSAISAHADVIRRKELVKLAEVNVRENQHILGLLKTRVAQGLSSDGDVRLVLGRLARAQASLAVHTQGYHTALATYTRITGQPVPKNLAPITLPKRIINDVDEARDVSANKNLRIRADLAAIQNAAADVDVAKSGFAPRISLDGGPSYSTQGYNEDPHQFSWSAMLNIQWEIFSGGRDVAHVKSKKSRVRELRQNLHTTMDSVNEEILATHAATQSSFEQSKYYAQAASASKQAKASYNEQFKLGQKDLLSVLDAEGEYFFSATEKVVRSTDAVLGQYRMLALTGDLLEELNIPQNTLLIDTTKAASGSQSLWSFKPTAVDAQEEMAGTTLTNKR